MAFVGTSSFVRGGRVSGDGRRARGRRPVAVRMSNVLIVNTGGGGHASIGLYLARILREKQHSVSIFNDGDATKTAAKDPFIGCVP
mmetsp:Transcript_56262/g.138174  ORF Transcript_56262/g.138174 Transcript_56262/m.138174 type:complete len:86 (+) Transcript_56262:901-1158(+)